MKMRAGFYWVRFHEDCYGKPNKKWTIAKYDGSSNYPWQVIGCDEIFKWSELEAGQLVAVPKGLEGKVEDCRE